MTCRLSIPRLGTALILVVALVFLPASSADAAPRKTTETSLGHNLAAPAELLFGVLTRFTEIWTGLWGLSTAETDKTTGVLPGCSPAAGSGECVPASATVGPLAGPTAGPDGLGGG